MVKLATTSSSPFVKRSAAFAPDEVQRECEDDDGERPGDGETTCVQSTGGRRGPRQHRQVGR